eukprot:gene7223-9687_t
MSGSELLCSTMQPSVETKDSRKWEIKFFAQKWENENVVVHSTSNDHLLPAESVISNRMSVGEVQKLTRPSLSLQYVLLCVSPVQFGFGVVWLGRAQNSMVVWYVVV